MSLLRSALVAPHPREARSGTQFPGQGTLPVRPVQCLLEVVFGRARGAGTAHQEQKLAFDPQQFGNCPPCFGAFGPFEPLLDRG